MSSTKDPDKYSLEEMMDRLQRRNPETEDDTGELVTRPDGSKAIRVRKRKRRTLQPQKEQLTKVRRMRMIQVSLVLLLALLVGIIAGGAMIFANSPIYRNRLIEGIASITGAESEMKEFRMNPQTANASSITLEWPEGNILRHGLIRGALADFHPVSFLAESLAGDEVRANKAEFHLDIPSPTDERTAQGTGGGMDLRFKRYTCSNVEIRVGPKTAPLLTLTDSEVTLQTLGRDGRPQLLINKGNLGIPNLPKYRISRGHLEFRGDDVEVVGIRILHETDERGKMKLHGIAQPYDISKPSTLTVELEELLLETLIGEHLGKSLMGRIDTVPSARSNFLSFAPSHQPKGVLAVEFQTSIASPFEFHGFPAFQQLAKLLDDKWYEKPVFTSEVTGSLRRENGEITFTDLECKNPSRLFLKGNLAMTGNRQLSGTMRIGTPHGVLDAARNRKLEQLFATDANGYLWTEITISGRGDAPLDNFSTLYENAGDVPVNRKSGIPGFEELTQPE